MAQRPVLETEELGYEPVSDFELRVGIAYAKERYGERLDRNMLEVFVNTVLERRSFKSKLPFLAAIVVRKVISVSNAKARARVNAYKGAIMKILSERSARKRQADARKRIERAPKPKPTEHPEDPKRKGQFVLL